MKIIRKNIKFIGRCVLALIVVASFLYALLILPRLNDENLIDLVMEGAHTGLLKPATEIAFEGQNKASDRIAEIENPTGGSQQKQEMAQAESPIVLFDISAQPVFEKNNKAVLILWIIIFASLVIFTVALIRKIIRKIRINKIKEEQ